MDTNALRSKIKTQMHQKKRGVIELSRAIGRSDSYLSAFLSRNKQEDIGFDTIRGLSRELGVSLSYFDEGDSFEDLAIGEADRLAAQLMDNTFRAARAQIAQRLSQPTTDSVIHQWQEAAGRLQHLDPLMPYVVIWSGGSGSKASPAVMHTGKASLHFVQDEQPNSNTKELMTKALGEEEFTHFSASILRVLETQAGILRSIRPAPALAPSVQLMLPVQDVRRRDLVLCYTTCLEQSLSTKNDNVSLAAQ